MNANESDPYQKAVEELELPGLTERQARIYLALVKQGELKASSIASQLKIHRLDVYNALKELQDKDLVQARISKP